MEIIKKVEISIIKFVSENFEFAKDYAEYAYILIALAVILILGMVANFLVKRFLLGVLRSLATKTKTKVAEYLLEESFFLRLSHLAPAFVTSSLSYLFFSDYPVLLGLVDVLVNLYLVGLLFGFLTH